MDQKKGPNEMSAKEWIGSIVGLGLMLACNHLPKALEEYQILVFILGIVLVLISGFGPDDAPKPKKKKKERE